MSNRTRKGSGRCLQGQLKGEREDQYHDNLYDYAFIFLFLHCTLTMAWRIRSWNIRGMGDPIKRALVLASMEGKGPGILCLQETHLTKDSMTHLGTRKFSYRYHSVHSSYSRGVSILISKGLPFSCEQSWIDEQGRYIFLACKIDNEPYILVNICLLYTSPSPRD